MEHKPEPPQTAGPAATPTTSTTPGSGSAVQLKRSLVGQPLDVQMKMMSPVQAKGDADGAVHEAAQKGIAGGGGALPHQERIQAAFGKHDVSGIKAHTGDNAKQASREMGADAYATGNDVVLGSKSDLHTVAHEAAHVVQQRGGVQLSGGVGKSGDAYEQHADQVADAVVAGKSAEGLLSKSDGAGGQAVQRSESRRIGREVQRSTTGTGPAVDPVVQRYLDDPTSHPKYGDFAAKARGTTIPPSVWGRAWASTIRAIHDPDLAARPGHFATVANLLRPHLTPPATGKVSFYSGDGSRPEAVKRGCSILEESQGARIFDGLDLTDAFADWGEVRPLWVTLSTTFAGNINRTVHAYLSYWNPRSIYVGDEMPVLQRAGIRRLYHPVAAKKDATGTLVDHTVLDAGGKLTNSDATMGESDCRGALDAWNSKAATAKDGEWTALRGGTP
jgi:hypothetical protein